jgi:diguanylate cyclase (GGDEF)-like protein
MQDRARAALDRERAARDRAAAAAERTRLERALLNSHIDDLTGAFRRTMGWQTLELEIDRARRGDGRFVLAFVDVDGLKDVNDRCGHAAGDELLVALVATIRSHLRSFDPVVRFGGDEFVCGLGGVDVADVARRFEEIRRSLRAETGSGITVGFATLVEGDRLDDMVRRADAELLDRRRSRPRSMVPTATGYSPTR